MQNAWLEGLECRRLFALDVAIPPADVLFEPPNTPPPPGGWRLAPFSSNYINALVADNATVVSPKAFGPKVNYNGSGNRDLFEDYATAAYRAAGYRTIVFTDARLYHDSGGSLHCGTNVIRAAPPDAKWWNV